MAFGARTAIDEAGLSVPGDVSLIGFDNWDLSGYSDMHLTTVERNMGDIAREGAECFCAVWTMELWITGEFIWIISLSYGIRYGT